MNPTRILAFGNPAARSRFSVVVILAFVGLALGGCWQTPKKEPYKELKLGKALLIEGAPFRTGGFPSNESCMNGNYTHTYEITTGIRTGEVWLCCIPVNELLREAFSCAEGALILGPYGLGSPDDLKVQFCLLYDALSTELRYTPACIPAPTSVDIPGEVR